MAAALARGWGDPVLASDSGSGRAAALVAELGGEALPNADVFARADVVILAHKPYQLEAVADPISTDTLIVSILGGTPVADLEAAYPDAPVIRVEPNVATAVGAGVDPAWVGRRVTGDTMLGDGTCRRRRRGHQHV